MSWLVPKYALKKGWGHTVRLIETAEAAFGETVDPDELEEVILWVDTHSQTRRISYDTWQFRSQEDAKSFIMLYNLTWC